MALTQDEAEKLARELKEQYLADMIVDDVYALCDHILSGDMKREIESAAYKRAAKYLEKRTSEFPRSAIGSAMAAIFNRESDAILSLIQPPAQKENGE